MGSRGRGATGRTAPRLMACALVAGLLWAAGCAASAPASGEGRPRVVVTYSVAGALVAQLVGDAATVEVLIEDGTDPHEWRPSAKDLESLRRATVIVDNGLDLEASLARALSQASAGGVTRFSLADHVTLRPIVEDAAVDTHDSGADPSHGDAPDEHDEHDEPQQPEQHEGAGEPDEHDADAPAEPDAHAESGGHAPSDGHGHGEGAVDPHLWTDPITMRQWVEPLAEVLGDHGIDVEANVAPLQDELDRLDAEVSAIIETIPPDRRRLVTGHESLGYFAQRYHLDLVGAVIPSFSSQAGAAAGALAQLVAEIDRVGVSAIFAEAGTPAATVEAIGHDAGVAVVELSTHALPPDGSYASFIRNLATTIRDALR